MAETEGVIERTKFAEEVKGLCSKQRGDQKRYREKM